MALRAWLVDTSALVRLAGSADAELWASRIQRGLVCISTPTLLELGWSSRSGSSLRAERSKTPLSLLPLQTITPAAEARAAEVQCSLADRGQHRGPGPIDLLIAAVAENASLTVLHVDHDFEVIAEVTGQPLDRLTVERTQP